jgi:hypothetical protein
MRFSVAVPTMWRSNRIIGMLEQLQSCDLVDEIIIIDNDYRNRLEVELGPKVKYLKQEENIFVNPAWNMAVSLAKNDTVCLLNDDVTFNVTELFSQVSGCFDRFKCMGVHPDSFKVEEPFYLRITPGADTRVGWGCCIFVDKREWVDIPSEIKIWYGDSWITDHYDEWSFTFPIRTEMHTTINSISKVNEVIVSDQEFWKTIHPDWIFKKIESIT